MFEVTLELVLLLVGVALLSGFVDAIAGGGGLITVPALMLVGASPVEALSTNKLQACFGTATAAATYARAGHVDVKRHLFMALISGCAGACGALVAHMLPVALLQWVMPFILIAVVAFFGLRKGLDDQDRVARMRPAVFAFTMVPLIGAYDGFFGPGTGAFFMLAFVLLAGAGVLRATASTKVLNVASNLGSLLVFASLGGVWWGTGLAMAVGQIVGATLGARMAMRVGAGLIRPLLVVTSGAMALRLLWQIWG